MPKAKNCLVPLIILTLLVASSGRVSAAGQRLVASGCSVSVVGYLSDLAADYEKLSGVKMFVRGGGSVIGLEDIRTGKSDFGAACRGKHPEDPEDIEFVQVAWDALVFIVNRANPVDRISFAEAQAVFGGSLRDWSQLKGPARPIQVFLQRPTTGLSGVESSLRTMVLRGRPPAPGANVAELASTGIVEQFVEKTPDGFGASGFSSARRREVKMLALDGVRPSKETISSRAYPLRRPLYLLVKKPASAEVRAFVDFTLGPKGQELISSYGAVSLREGQ